MKIFAYSDTHFGTSETLAELGLQPDFTVCDAFVGIVEKEKPDMVICCGDFSELIWDGGIDYGETFKRIRDITDKFLQGNHERVGEVEHEAGDVVFTHGHKLHFNVAGEEGRQALYSKASGLPKFVVFGHTHRPHAGDGFIDMGSLTLTKTFCEVNDGQAELRYI